MPLCINYSINSAIEYICSCRPVTLHDLVFCLSWKLLGFKFQLASIGSHSLKIDMEHQAEKPAAVLTGTAKAGRVGPPLGTVDIGQSESAYIFRVALPGVHQHDSNLRCNVQADGRVNIDGLVRDSSLLNDMRSYEMKVERLCPRGPFSVAFNLPGPVDPRLCSLNFRPDGILEVVVKTKMG
ncbi:increased DNA methylation 3-like isoform X1 [Rhododendron vialii]|uniref:increased DNA methylation 3-like isoform X1 n=2 Tax=Rhododendron vialii TaxID=182163 RepID=UPI00265EE005|nr:increased DNA methylation 3-like isoform X1 [Rhododendron vialii]